MEAGETPKTTISSIGTPETSCWRRPAQYRAQHLCDTLFKHRERRAPDRALGAAHTNITFNYYGVKKTNKQRLKGWQLVWTHPSKSELQSNSEVKLKGYEVADVELPLTAVCQKVIVPVEYTYCGKSYFRLAKADVKEVLKYKSLD